MPYVRSFDDFAPPRRFDGVAFTQALIQEAAASTGPWTTIETKTLSPVDADPANPQLRDFTTALATLASGWYRIVWKDAAASTFEGDAVFFPTTSSGHPSALRERLKKMVAWDLDPALTETEIDDLLSLAKSGRPARAALTYYKVDQVVVPATPNGHYYTCTVAGTSASGEPSWPTTTATTVVDGGVTWKESGLDEWTPTYDVNAAAAEGWRWKAARVANLPSFSLEGQRVERSDLHKHCVEQAEIYDGRTLTYVRLGTGAES